MPINLLEDDEAKQPINLLEGDENSSPQKVNTFLGQMPKELPQFKFGTEQNKDLVGDLLEAGAGAPGMNVIGQGLKKGAQAIGSFGKKAIQSKAPLEKSLAEATQELEGAEKAAQAPKTGVINQLPGSELENLENDIGKFINVEGKHDVDAARAITNRVQSIEDYWSNAYKSFEDKIKDAQFQMPAQALGKLDYSNFSATQLVQKFGNDAYEAIKQGKLGKFLEKQTAKEAKNPYFEGLLKSAPTASDTDAATFIAKYRDFRDTLGGLKADMKSKNISSLEKKKISEAIKNGKEIEKQVKQALNEGLGQFKTEFDWLNEGYSQQVFPLRQNPIVKAAKKGKLSDNIIKSLRTNESGMPLLREVVKNDPELLRNVIGQRYRIKPSEVHAPNELMREYLNELPEFKSLISKKENLLAETAKRKDITLKKKLDIEKKLQEIKQAKKKLLIGGAIGLGTIGIPGSALKIGKMLIGSSNE